MSDSVSDSENERKSQYDEPPPKKRITFDSDPSKNIAGPGQIPAACAKRIPCITQSSSGSNQPLTEKQKRKRERQRRYRERHREVLRALNRYYYYQRRKNIHPTASDPRLNELKVMSDDDESTKQEKKRKLRIERDRRYRVKNREVIKQRNKVYRQRHKNVQQKSEVPNPDADAVPNCDVDEAPDFAMAKTARERMQEVRARKRSMKIQKPTKTLADRNREYKARKKPSGVTSIEQNQLTNESSTNVSLNQDECVGKDELSQPDTIEEISNRPESKINYLIIDQIDSREPHTSQLKNVDGHPQSSADEERARVERSFIVVQVDEYVRYLSGLNDHCYHHSNSDEKRDNSTKSNENTTENDRAKSSTERGREYRARKNAMKTKKRARTTAERCQDYRARKKTLDTVEQIQSTDGSSTDVSSNQDYSISHRVADIASREYRDTIDDISNDSRDSSWSIDLTRLRNSFELEKRKDSAAEEPLTSEILLENQAIDENMTIEIFEEYVIKEKLNNAGNVEMKSSEAGDADDEADKDNENDDNENNKIKSHRLIKNHVATSDEQDESEKNNFAKSSKIVSEKWSTRESINENVDVPEVKFEDNTNDNIRRETEIFLKEELLDIDEDENRKDSLSAAEDHLSSEKLLENRAIDENKSTEIFEEVPIKHEEDNTGNVEMRNSETRDDDDDEADKDNENDKIKSDRLIKNDVETYEEEVERGKNGFTKSLKIISKKSCTRESINENVDVPEVKFEDNTNDSIRRETENFIKVETSDIDEVYLVDDVTEETFKPVKEEGSLKTRSFAKPPSSWVISQEIGLTKTGDATMRSKPETSSNTETIDAPFQESNVSTTKTMEVQSRVSSNSQIVAESTGQISALGVNNENCLTRRKITVLPPIMPIQLNELNVDNQTICSPAQNVVATSAINFQGTTLYNPRFVLIPGGKICTCATGKSKTSCQCHQRLANSGNITVAAVNQGNLPVKLTLPVLSFNNEK